MTHLQKRTVVSNY